MYKILRKNLPDKIKNKKIVNGPLYGMRMVTSWRDYPAALLGRTERPLLIWLQRHVQPGQTWLDIGAHYGYTALALSQYVGVKGRVLAFEPVLATAGCISQTRKLNQLSQLQIVPFALHDQPGLQISELPLIRGMADSTIRDASEMVAFQQASLDWLWFEAGISELALHRMDGVKIDVQGMELKVLSGMRRCLMQFRPKIVIELHAGVDREQFRGLMSELGYPNPGESVETGSLAHDYRDDCSYAFFPG